MSQENKDRKDPSDSRSTQNLELNKDYIIICPEQECYSSIEISSINEENNIISFKCIKTSKKFIMSIKEYLEKIKEIKHTEQLEDTCKLHLQKNTSYCFDCKGHLCDECLKTRIHIYHKKSNIIEVKPTEDEINIIKEVLKDYDKKLENLRKEKNNKKKEIEEKEDIEIKNEKIKL